MSIGMLAATYARHGWKLVRLHGCVGPSICTCLKGSDCGTPGKHPQAKAWQLHATDNEDEVMAWFEEDRPVNVGLLLGPASGVIDVELDGPEAEQAWQSLGLGEIYTPTYKAARGPHRLFRWCEGLPAVAVKKVMGIEIRIGNGGAAAQSVIPPSVHHTGVRYEWLEGLSPDDVELQPLPERLLNLLWNDDGTGIRFGGPSTRRKATALLHGDAGVGERNDLLHRFAVREAFRSGPNLDDEEEQRDLLAKIHGVNLTSCKPPLDDAEVMSIYRSSIAYVRKSRAAGVHPDEAMRVAELPKEQRLKDPRPRELAPWQRQYTESGLSFAPLVPGTDSPPEWGPGEWRLTVIHSDPLEYRLHVPGWRQWTAGGTGNVSLTVDQYRSATKVAAAVLAATGVVMLDDSPKKWRGIWDGGIKIAEIVGHDKENKPITRSRLTRGVKAKLLDNVQHEWPGASSLRYVLLAGWLYDRLAQASQPNDEDSPDATGRACWRQDGTLWFSWGRIWEDIERQHKINEGERLAMKRRILARMDGKRDFDHAQHRHPGGTRKSYVVWTPAEFAVLESMANEDRVHLGDEGDSGEEAGETKSP